MNKKSDLEQMKEDWERHGIATQFSKVHHFSSDKFATNPSGLNGFYNWCIERDILDENYQTLQRANRVVALIESGVTTQTAINQAWKDFPICTR